MDSEEELNYLLLTRDVLDVGAINALATASNCGAISLFVGTTRDNFEQKKVLSLEYEAYEPMALKEMQAICFELRKRWPDIAKIVIYHRVGLVPVGQASVVIAVSSPHRVTALEAVAIAIEELKKRVPIWKKEKYEGDESAWKENKESDKFDENFCRIQENDSSIALPPQYVQISASEMEINRRIQCFVEKKREEIDLNNIIDYARPTMDPNKKAIEDDDNITNEDDNEIVTCARTNSTIIKQESSKGHLKVSQTENYIGPQIRHYYVQQNMENPQKTEEGDIKPIKLVNLYEKKPSFKNTTIPQALIDRIENMEEHLNMNDDTRKDITKRIKALEERLLYLESISPEYRHFLSDKPQDSTNKSYHFPENPLENKPQPINNTKVYNVDDINMLIEEFS